MSRTLHIDGVEVLVEGPDPDVDPDADTLVMIHGWPDSLRLWDAQVEALRAHCRCVRFTLPGFEASRPGRPRSWAGTLALIGRIVEAVSPDRPVVLLLHDWGCPFGYQFAMANPARVRGVIGVDVGDAGSRPHLRSIGLAGMAATAAYQGWLALAWRIGGPAGDAMTRAMARVARAAGGPTDPRRTHAGMDYPYAFLWSGAYSAWLRRADFRPPGPVLYLWGRRKPFMFHSPRWLERLAVRAGDKALGLDTGHWPMVERPAEFNRAVLDWLADTRAMRAGMPSGPRKDMHQGGARAAASV